MEGKKRKNVAKCFGLFQRKVHKKGLPGVWEAKLKDAETTIRYWWKVQLFFSCGPKETA